MDDSKVMIVLSADTLNKVLNILAQLPYNQSAAVINEINTEARQVNTQKSNTQESNTQSIDPEVIKSETPELTKL